MTARQFTFVIALWSVASIGQVAPPPAPKLDSTSETAGKQLRTMVEGVHKFHAQTGMWPPDIRDRNGKVLLSVRVELLQTIGEGKLYQQFKLDEPWDSEHNKKLIPKIPKVYDPVRGKAKEGETFFQPFVGPRTVLDWPHKYPLNAIPDGASNVVLFVEAREPIIWTKPDTLAFDYAKEMPKLGAVPGEDFPIAFCDGVVKTVKKNYSPKELKVFIACDDSRQDPPGPQGSDDAFGR